ncbi:MAG TPA: NAD(P)H-dependent oxidoreductase [Rhizomicrobium sp.]|jgi:NAD(P)H-dependent FMN reductase|nr:NAD(P)H-dependent oxidoreductase [Rhizomicrobium sp.]
MSGAVKLIAFSGSMRHKSYNHSLVQIAAHGARKADAEVELINLIDFDLPLYNADLEARDGLPQSVLALKALCLASDGYLISAPEYNGSLPAVLKNAIDWLSRPGPAPGETAITLSAYRGKVAGIMSASPGAWGGVRGLAHLRQILSGMGVLVTAEQLAVPAAMDAFDGDGRLKNPVFHALVETIGARSVQLARALKNPTA